MSDKPVNVFKDDMTGRLLLGRYRTVRKLAAGGMGVVYLARAEGAAGFVKPVVVKLMLPDLSSDDEFLGMFIREAKILSSLSDPGIVDVIDFAREDNFYVMVLEYVHGFQLKEWMSYLKKRHKRMIPTGVVIQVIIDVLDSLHTAHTYKGPNGKEMPIIHRDISPTNILITTEGRTKLVDFGIARMEEATDGYKTQTAGFKGKLSYSAPERFANRKADICTDIYAIGVTLHEALVGRNEFFTKDPAGTIGRVLSHNVSSVEMKRDDAPRNLDNVIKKALAKNPSHRYQSAAEFADALRGLRGMNERTAKDLLSASTRKDFTDDMAEFLNVESLTARENAWRCPSSMPARPPYEDDKTQPVVRDTQGSVTLSGEEIDIPIDISISPKNARPSRAPSVYIPAKPIIILSVAILLAAGGVVAFFATRPETVKKPNRYLLVNSSADAEEDPLDDTEQTPETEMEEPTAAPPAAEEKPPAKRSGAPSKGFRKKQVRSKERQMLIDLTQAFRKQKGPVQSCIMNNPKNLEEVPVIKIFFTIDAKGTVQSSRITPAILNNQPVGACIKAIAKTTTFPGQGSAITFNIPIRTISK